MGPSMAREGIISGREILPEKLFRMGVIYAISDAQEPPAAKLDTYLDQLQKAAPRAAAINKQLTRIGWGGPQSKRGRTYLSKRLQT